MVQDDNTLTCIVSGDDNLSPTITYQWTRNNSVTVGTNSRTLLLSSVGLSDAGNYTCHATVNSGLLTNSITMSDSQIVMVQSELVKSYACKQLIIIHALFQHAVPTLSVTVSTSTGSNIIRDRTAVTVNCVVEFSPSVMESDLSLLMVEVQLSRDGTVLSLAGPTAIATGFTFGAYVSCFSDSDVGNYSCDATVTPTQSSSQFLTGMGQGTSPLVPINIYNYNKSNTSMTHLISV